MPLSVVILAAGQGTRMRSARPKVLHPVAGRPMLAHVIATARALSPDGIHVVHGHGGERVREQLDGADVSWVEQPRQLGTGDAVRVALPGIPEDHRVLVLCGDVPLIRAETLVRLLETAGTEPGLLTVEMADPTSYGRILRDAAGHVAGIVEEKDATAAQRGVREINTGLMVLPAGPLSHWLKELSADNAQGEYYLTDVIGLARRAGVAVHAVATDDAAEVQGVNNRVQLAVVERAYQRRAAEALMRGGVTLLDPERFDLRGELEAGTDCVLDANVIVEGHVRLGDDVHVEANCVLRDCRLGDGAYVAAHSVIEGATLAAGAHAGPFARLRPGTVLGRGARAGNFVEMKNATLGEGSKVNHLSYVGDAEVGRGVNVGAGTITCNYDGARKHRTVIEDGAFIGSDTQLVAPVRVGRNATIGAGTSLRRDAPAEALTVTDSRQRTITDWQRPSKERDADK